MYDVMTVMTLSSSISYQVYMVRGAANNDQTHQTSDSLSIRPQTSGLMTQTISDASPGTGVAPSPSSRLCCRDRELPEWAGLSPRLPLPQHTGPVRTSEDWRVPMLGSVEVPPSSSQVTEATLSSVSGCRPWLGTNSQTKHTNLIIYFTFVEI